MSGCIRPRENWMYMSSLKGLKDKTETYKQRIHEKFTGLCFKFFLPFLLPRFFDILVPVSGPREIVCDMYRFQCLTDVK